jgi:hypothetical protein
MLTDWPGGQPVSMAGLGERANVKSKAFALKLRYLSALALRGTIFADKNAEKFIIVHYICR